MAGQVATSASLVPPQHADANLLFGVLALQMDFVDRDQLIAGMQAWANAKGTSLADHLVRLDALRPERRRLLDPVVAEHVRRRESNFGLNPAAAESLAQIEDDLKQMGDPDVLRSLQDMRSLPSMNVTCLQESLPSESLRFQILRPHARGGLGEVFVARDSELGREVALKEIQLDKSDDAEARSRFIREAEITGGLEHPGVVPVYSLGAYPDGRPFYAMRFIRGQTLHDAIKAFHAAPQPGATPLTAAQRNLELRKLLQRFIDVCEAIDYAHSRGVLHRDLKPGNIMLGRYGETLVVDWGLAKAGGDSTARPRESTRASAIEPVEFVEPQLSPSASHESTPTQMGFVPGTPAYMSPEHALGRIDLMGPASDVFSLGATLYHLLTGRPPYAGHDVKEVQRQAQSGSYPRPGSIASIPKPLEAICCKAMAIEPAQRYVTTSGLAADIERYLADEPVSAYREPTRSKVSRWMRRHSRLVAGGVICFLIVPICLGSGLFVALQQKHLAQTAEDLAEVGQLCASTTLAHHALQAGDHPAAARALKKIPPHRHSWVYQYLFSQLAFHNVVEGESGGISCLAMQPDGDELAYGTKSGEICLRDGGTGAVLRRASIAKGESITALAFSGSAVELAAASGRAIQILNATTLETKLRIPLTAPVSNLVFTPDDRHLLVTLAGREARAVAIQLANGTQSWSFPLEASAANICFVGPEVVCLAASSKVSTLDLATGALRSQWTLAAGEEVTALLPIAVTKRLLVGTSQGRALVYDAASGVLIRELERVRGSIVGARAARHANEPTEWVDQYAAIVGAMSLRDSSEAVLVSAAGDVWIVNYQTGAVGKQLINKGVLTTAGSLAGPRIAMADQDEVFVFDAALALRPLSKQSRIFPDVAAGAAISPDGRLALFAIEDRQQPGQSKIIARDLDGDDVGWTISSSTPDYLGFSPDGRLAVAVGETVRVFDTRSGACLMQSARLYRSNRAASAVIDTTNRYVAVDGDTLQVWDVGTGEKLAESTRLEARNLQLSSSGRELIAQVDEGIRIWRIPDLKEIGRQKSDPSNQLVGITRDNQLVIREGSRLMARNWPGLGAICDFEHDGPALCIDFHPVCERIVTGGADGKLNVWHYPSGEKLLELPFSRTVMAVRFSLDGTRLVAIDREGKVEVWDSTPKAAEKLANDADGA